MTCVICGGEARRSDYGDHLVHVVVPWLLDPPHPWHRATTEESA